ncbi:MAG: hypothetical protein FWG50_10260 [Kiritimatiellaeota bacterium]|nr:hypothetical protein [Kiritimatiellota bacterium]
MKMKLFDIMFDRIIFAQRRKGAEILYDSYLEKKLCVSAPLREIKKKEGVPFRSTSN